MTNKKVSELEERFSSLEKKLDSEIGALRSEANQNHEQLKQRLDELKNLLLSGTSPAQQPQFNQALPSTLCYDDLEFPMPPYHAILQRFDLLTVHNETLFWSPNLLLQTSPTSKVYRSKFKKPALAFKRLVSKNVDDRRRFFQTEKEVLEDLIHDNIIHTTGYCQEGDDHVIVFDHVEGSRTLDQVLRDADTVLTFEQRLHIAREVAQGIQFMHFQRNPVTHSNINSKNILVGSGKNMVVKITGFEKAARITQTKEAPHHQRPENDIYDFGIFLLELMTGEDIIDEIPFISSIEIQLSLMDQWIRNSITPEAATKLIKLAQDCIHPDVGKRPDAAMVALRLRY